MAVLVACWVEVLAEVLTSMVKGGGRGVFVAGEKMPHHALLAHLPLEIIFIELMPSDRKLKASREGSK